MITDNIIEAWEKDEKRIIVEGIVIRIVHTAIKFCIAGIILFAAGRYLGVW